MEVRVLSSALFVSLTLPGSLQKIPKNLSRMDSFECEADRNMQQIESIHLLHQKRSISGSIATIFSKPLT